MAVFTLETLRPVMFSMQVLVKQLLEETLTHQDDDVCVSIVREFESVTFSFLSMLIMYFQLSFSCLLPSNSSTLAAMAAFRLSTPRTMGINNLRPLVSSANRKASWLKP